MRALPYPRAGVSNDPHGYFSSDRTHRDAPCRGGRPDIPAWSIRAPSQVDRVIRQCLNMAAATRPGRHRERVENTR